MLVLGPMVAICCHSNPPLSFLSTIHHNSITNPSCYQELCLLCCTSYQQHRCTQHPAPWFLLVLFHDFQRARFRCWHWHQPLPGIHTRTFSHKYGYCFFLGVLHTLRSVFNKHRRLWYKKNTHRYPYTNAVEGRILWHLRAPFNRRTQGSIMLRVIDSDFQYLEW